MKQTCDVCPLLLMTLVSVRCRSSTLVNVCWKRRVKVRTMRSGTWWPMELHSPLTGWVCGFRLVFDLHTSFRLIKENKSRLLMFPSSKARDIPPPPGCSAWSLLHRRRPAASWRQQRRSHEGGPDTAAHGRRWGPHCHRGAAGSGETQTPEVLISLYLTFDLIPNEPKPP